MKAAQAKVYWAAAAARIRRLIRGAPDLYPPPPGAVLSPSEGIAAALAAVTRGDAPPVWGGDPQALDAWRLRARDRLAYMTGYDRARAAAEGPPTLTAERPAQTVGPGIVKRSLYLRVRPHTDAPVHVIHRADLDPTVKAPVFLHLAGSTSGVHLAWGEARVPIDHERIAIGADMARQAAARGYLAVAIEQSGYGERSERRLPKRSADRTIDAHNHLTLIGRSLMGDGAADVSAALDHLFSGTAGYTPDPARVVLFGHSAGGTLAQFAAALDSRITGVLVSGALGPWRETIGARGAPGGDAIVPGLLAHFEASDLTALVAPRAFVGLSGRADHIFPFDGVQAVVEEARPVFAALRAEHRLGAVGVDGPHRYYAEASWEAIGRWIDPPEGEGRSGLSASPSRRRSGTPPTCRDRAAGGLPDATAPPPTPPAAGSSS
jgi:dienelactone hydrolase